MHIKLTLLIYIFVLFSCASAPKTYLPLNEAKTSIAQAQQEEALNQVASVTLFQANEYLQNAEQALTENDIETVDHYIYLAKRKLDIAHELLLKQQTEEQLLDLKQQQQELIATARHNESKRAQQKVQRVQKRVKKLEKVLGQYQAEETSRGTLLVINDLLFDSGGATLKQESFRRLEPLAQYLQGNPHREIIIEGHTDSIGNEETNKTLSQLRADAVKNFLVERNIHADRIETRGFGEEVPVASNTTNAGRKLNRRVEIVIKTVRN